MNPVQSVAVVNRSSLPDDEVALMVVGYGEELVPLCAAWSLPVPGLVLYRDDHEQRVSEEAALIFVDSSDEPDAFGYHTGLGVAAWGYVDVGLCRAYGEPVSRVFGHELLELVVDPGVNRWAGPFADGTHVAVEVCDPVQRNSRAARVEDDLLGEAVVEIADWVGPDWFQERGDVSSYQGTHLRCLTDAEGGYHVTERNGVVVTGAARVKSIGRTFRRLTTGRR